MEDFTEDGTNENKLEKYSALEKYAKYRDHSETEQSIYTKTEIRYKRLLDNLPGIVYQLKINTDSTVSFLYISDTLSAVTGLSSNEVIEDPSVFISKIHPEDIKVFKEDLLKAASLSRYHHAIFRYLKDGYCIWLEMNATLERLYDGTVLSDGFILDITESKKEQIRKSWEALNQDSEGQKFEKEILPELLAKGKWKGEIEGKRKDGVEFSQDVSLTAIDGNGFIYAVRDVTELKDNETKIKNLEKLIEVILASSSVGTGKVRNKIILWVDEKVSNLTGYSKDELIGKNPSIFYENIEEYKRATDILYLEGQVQTKLLRPDGILKDVFIHLSPGDDNSYFFTVIDITQQKEIEDSLMFTRFAMDNVLDMVIVFRQDGSIFYVNHSACKMQGYSRDELLSMTIFDISPAYSKEKWIHAWKVTRENNSFSIETNLKRRNGTVFPVEITGRFLVLGNNEHICVFIRDISERKSMEINLKNSMEMFRALFESSGDAIMIIKDVIIDCNEKTVEMFDKTKEEIVGQPVQFFSQEYLAFNDNCHDETQNKMPRFFEWKYQRTDGTILCAEVYFTRIIINGESFIQVNIRDITSRKQTEEKLMWLSTAIEQAAEDIVITDPEGKIKYVNPAFEKITGYSIYEVVGKTPRILKSGVQDNEFYEELWNTGRRYCP